jgi:ribonuclease E
VGLLEAFSTPCEHCRGRGVVVSSNPVESGGDGGQHNSAGGGGGGGRRRGRGGGDHGNDQQSGSQHGGGDQQSGGQHGGGGQGGGQHGNGGQQNGGNSNGRRRGGGSPSEVATAREHPPAAEDHASPNGKSGASPVSTPHDEPDSSARPVAPLDRGSSAAPDVASTVPEVAPEAAAAVPEAAPDAGSAVPETPVGPVPASDVADTAPAQQPVPGAGTASPNGADAEQAASYRAGAELAVPGDESARQPEPVSIGAGNGESARPARRRRRSASRPAGPPSAGAEGGGTADPV